MLTPITIFILTLMVISLGLLALVCRRRQQAMVNPRIASNRPVDQLVAEHVSMLVDCVVHELLPAGQRVIPNNLLGYMLAQPFAQTFIRALNNSLKPQGLGAYYDTDENGRVVVRLVTTEDITQP